MNLTVLLGTATLALVPALASAGMIKKEISLTGLPGNFELNNATITCDLSAGATPSAVIDPYDRFGIHGAKIYGNYIQAVPSGRRGIVYLVEDKLRIIWQNTSSQAREWEEYLADGSRNPPDTAPLNLWIKFPNAPVQNCDQ